MTFNFPSLPKITFNITGCNFYGNPIPPKPETKEIKESNYYDYEEESQKKINDIVRVENRNGKRTYHVKYTPGATVTIGGRRIHFK